MKLTKLTGLALSLIICCTANAAPRLAITDFELNDITSLPNTQQERVRTASMKPLLEQALIEAGNFTIVPIDAAAQSAGMPEFNHLFKFDDAAADLGKQSGADWIIVNQHSKPSFLFSYLMAHVINVKTGRQIASFDIELKGNHEKVTRRGVANLARRITAVIADYDKQ